MEKMDKLSLLVGGLSAVVLLQTVFILNRIDSTNIRSAEQLPLEIESKVEKISLAEAKNYIGNQDGLDTNEVRIWMSEDENDVLELNRNVSIWLEARNPIASFDVLISFDPKILAVFDQNFELEGTQISYGEVDTYLDNWVDFEEGVIHLSGIFENGFSGRILLGKIMANKQISEENTNLKFLYSENSKQETYVLGGEEKLMKLEVGGGIEL
jgi:hypothetical protein